MVRREARKEMPNNIAALKRPIEQGCLAERGKARSSERIQPRATMLASACSRR